MNENEQRTHTTVLLEQAVAALNVKNSGTYVDGTYGRGGHSRAILGRLAAQGRLYAFDRDAAAVQACEIKDERFELIHAPFASMQAALHSRQVEAVDGVLLDLGVSSPQLDDAARGFSFRFDGPLDMRMDTSCGMSAEQWLNSADEKQIGEVIRNYGEERFAKQIARAIVAARERGPIQRTSELAQIVGNTVRTREPGQHPATRSFQAIRIFINQELEELQVVLPQCVHLLRAEGRLVVISFHSLEDRIVKRFMQHEAKADHLPDKLPVRAKDVNQAKLKLIGRACKPDYAEVANNSRARSAVMRVAEKLPHRVAA